jgi:SAM-dependent methyltransferase
MTVQDEKLRYGFGKNWANFIKEKLSDEIIESSRAHMASLLRTDNLAGKTFLDIGCGSGIHSLAALRMGAERIISFDYDQDSVNTTQLVREWAGAPSNWSVFQGSVLDKDLMNSLDKADIVYSWGVLHHTGSMWQAVENAAIPLKPGGVFYISLYSSDNYVDPTPEYWLDLKRRYNRAGSMSKAIMEFQYAYRFHIGPALRSGQNPLKTMREYGDRGMTYWTDVKDWLGGYPMEFASLVETRTFAEDRLGLKLVNLKTGEGCTEYVFADPKANAFWGKVEAGRRQHPLNGPFVPMGGYGYAAPTPQLVDTSDGPETPRRSKVMVYEDGHMLGLAHSIHHDIRIYGKGRFSHWGAEIFFAPSDGSDPNNNGRVYTYCEEF